MQLLATAALVATMREAYSALTAQEAAHTDLLAAQEARLQALQAAMREVCLCA